MFPVGYIFIIYYLTCFLKNKFKNVYGQSNINMTNNNINMTNNNINNFEYDVIFEFNNYIDKLPQKPLYF